MPAYPFYGRIDLDAPDEHDDDQRVECATCDGLGEVRGDWHPEVRAHEMDQCADCQGSGWGDE